MFGDGYFGRPLENNAIITVRYIITEGKAGNGPSQFNFQGNFVDEKNLRVIPTDTINVTTTQKAMNGGDIENVSSIKYFAPRLYASNLERLQRGIMKQSFNRFTQHRICSGCWW